MPTEDIPPEQWSWFCAGFSRQHAGWLAELQISAPATGVQPLAAGASLHALKYEPAEERIVVKLDCDEAQILTHTLDRPRRITLDRDAQGAHTGLEIESQGGEELLLRFPVTVPMEMLDGAEGTP